MLRGEKIPVIFMTAQTDGPCGRELSKQAAVSVLLKPFNETDHLAVVARSRFERAVQIGRSIRDPFVPLKFRAQKGRVKFCNTAVFPRIYTGMLKVPQSAKPQGDFRAEASIPQGAAPLESILRTEELRRRPSRAPDYEKENRALMALAAALADPKANIFQRFAEIILQTTDCDSSGLSLLTREDGGKRFYWPAIAGMWKTHIGGGTPRNFGPCGDVLDRNCTLLFTHVERRYTYFSPVTPLIEECLLVPFYIGGKAVGTIWAILHNDRRRFDAEDERLMNTVAQFASLAYQTVDAIEGLKVEIAAREKAEAELRQLASGLEAKAQRLVDANVIGIALWSLEGAITEANEAFLRMIQCSREDLVSGRVRWMDLTPAEWRDRDHSAIAELRATGIFQPFEKEYFRKDRSRVPVLIGGALFEKGGNEGVAFVLDLSEQKRAEAALRAAMSERTRLSAVRAEVATALASKDDLHGILNKCADALVRHLDAAFARIWTLKPGGSELELQASAGIYTRLDGSYSRIPIGHMKIGLIAKERQAHLTNDVQNDPRISDHKWAKTENIRSFAGYPLVLEDRVVGVIGMFSRYALTENTLESLAFIADGIAQGIERKRAEDALRSSEQNLRLTLDTIDGLVTTVSPSGELQSANRRFLEYTGNTIEELKTNLGILHPDDRERVMRQWTHALRTGEALYSEARIRRHDGVFRWFVMTALPLTDRDNHILRWYNLITDIQDRREAEEKLHRTQEDLRNAQAEYAHLNRVMTMGELTASIAHEVNQPLAAIVSSGDSCAAWLAHEPPNLDKARAAASRMVQAATQASEIVQRIRGLFKKHTSIAGAVDVNEVIEETIAFVDRETQRKNVSLRTELAVGLPSVNGDRVQLQQVILNLMMNGLEAMADLDSEPKSLLIRSAFLKQRELLVSIADTGPGIDAEHAGRLFAPFFTTKPHGIGMGLRISRSIIEAHGGRLWAEKNEPCGAVFHFILPIKADQ
jgi:PAS domain S-box-containing protein